MSVREQIAKLREDLNELSKTLIEDEKEKLLEKMKEQIEPDDEIQMCCEILGGEKQKYVEVILRPRPKISIVINEKIYNYIVSKIPEAFRPGEIYQLKIGKRVGRSTRTDYSAAIQALDEYRKKKRREKEREIVVDYEPGKKKLGRPRKNSP